MMIIVLGLSIISCSDDKSSKNRTELEEKRVHRKNIDSLNLASAIKMAKFNHADIVWDTAFWFTYHIQEKFEQKGQPILYIGEIKDIAKKDSIYVLYVSESSYHFFKDHTAEIEVSESKFKELEKEIKDSKENEGGFIIKINRITTNYPKLTSEVDNAGSEDASSYLTYDFDDLIVKIKGSLIDYYIYKTAED